MAQGLSCKHRRCFLGFFCNGFAKCADFLFFFCEGRIESLFQLYITEVFCFFLKKKKKKVVDAGRFELVGGRGTCGSFFHALPLFPSSFLLSLLPLASLPSFIPPSFTSSFLSAVFR